MKNFIINVVSFVLGAVIGAAAGATVMTAGQLTITEMREMTEEMSKHFDQI